MVRGNSPMCACAPSSARHRRRINMVAARGRRGRRRKMSIFDAAMRDEKAGILSSRSRGKSMARARRGLCRLRSVVARSSRRPSRELRAHTPLEPRRNGHSAPRVRVGREREHTRPHLEETFSIEGRTQAIPKRRAVVRARLADGTVREFVATVRIDTPQQRRAPRHAVFCRTS